MKSSFSRPSPVILHPLRRAAFRFAAPGRGSREWRPVRRDPAESVGFVPVDHHPVVVAVEQEDEPHVVVRVFRFVFRSASGDVVRVHVQRQRRFARKRQRRQLFAADARLFGNLAVGGVQHRVVRRFDVSAGLQPFAELAVFEQQYPVARPTDDHAAGGDMAG